MTSQEALALATRKARNGEWNATIETAEAVKQAMLAVGTKGRWTAVSRYTYVQRWRDGVTILRNASVGVHPNQST